MAIVRRLGRDLRLYAFDPEQDARPQQLLISESVSSLHGMVSRVHGLADGRLIFAYIEPDLPSRGGWLQILAPPYSGDWSARVELPRSVDAYSLTDDGVYLYVVGSNGFAGRIPLDSIPAPEEAL